MVVLSVEDGLGVVVVVGEGIKGTDGLQQPHPEQGRDGAGAESVDEVLGVVEGPLAVEDSVVLLDVEIPW